MKQYFWITGIIITTVIACGSNKQVAGIEQEDNASSPVANNSVPVCIFKMIDSTKKQDPALQLTEVRRYVYNGAKVYLVGAPCCDQFNVVYDSACNYLFAPSGGFTGKGDGSQPQFFKEAKEDSLIWSKEKQ